MALDKDGSLKLLKDDQLQVSFKSTEMELKYLGEIVSFPGSIKRGLGRTRLHGD